MTQSETHPQTRSHSGDLPSIFKNGQLADVDQLLNELGPPADAQRTYAPMFLVGGLAAAAAAALTVPQISEGLTGCGLLLAPTARYAAGFAVLLGALGALSIVRAVFVRGRQLECASIGGRSRLPLGLVSLPNQAGLVAVGLWLVLAPALT